MPPGLLERRPVELGGGHVAGDGQERRGVHQRRAERDQQVGRAGPDRGERGQRLVADPVVGVGDEAGRRLVVHRQGGDLFAPVVQRVEQAEITVPAQPHHIGHPLPDEVVGDDLRALHATSSRRARAAYVAYYATIAWCATVWQPEVPVKRELAREARSGLLAGRDRPAHRRAVGAGGPGLEVLDKYTQQPTAAVARATAADVGRAVTGRPGGRAARCRPPGGRPSWPRRPDCWRHAAEVTAQYIDETGFTRADAETELARAIATLRLSAEEAIRIAGEEMPVAATPGSENRLAFTIRVPVGVVAAIAPFNAPLNTVVHKVGPAIAAGNAVVLKPAEQTPLCSMALARILLDAGLPPGFLQLVCGPGETAGAGADGRPAGPVLHVHRLRRGRPGHPAAVRDHQDAPGARREQRIDRGRRRRS